MAECSKEILLVVLLHGVISERFRKANVVSRWLASASKRDGSRFRLRARCETRVCLILMLCRK